MKCYNCEKQLIESWNYCPNCKRRIKQKNKIKEEEFVSCDLNGKCKKCSFELEDSWNFCPICSSKNDFTCEIKIKEEQEQKDFVKKEKKKIGICNHCKADIFEHELYCSKCEAEVKMDKNSGKVETKQGDSIYNLYLCLCVFSFILIILFNFAELDVLNIIACISFLFFLVLFKFRYPKDVLANLMFYGFIVLSILTVFLLFFFKDFIAI